MGSCPVAWCSCRHWSPCFPALAGLISAPLRARFGIVHRLDFYRPEELTEIVLRSAKLLGVPIEQTGAEEIARRSRGTRRAGRA